MTLAVDAYEVSMRERSLSGATIERARYHLNKLLATAKNGHRPLAWLTPKRAEQLYAAAREGVATDTHRNSLAVGKMFGRWCADKGWLPADPFAKVKGIGKRKRGKPQLSTDESARLYVVCLAERSRESLAVATGLMLGWGPSEVVDRRVRDLDAGGSVLRMTHGKNVHRVRACELPDDLRLPLAELARERPGAAYLFGASDLERPSRYWHYWHCLRLCRLAGVPPVTPHGLRGTHATIALGAAVTSHSVRAALAAAQASLGHVPGSPITATTYVAPGAVDAAAAAVVAAALGNLSAGAVSHADPTSEKASAIERTRTSTVLPTGT